MVEIVFASEHLEVVFNGNGNSRYIYSSGQNKVPVFTP